MIVGVNTKNKANLTFLGSDYGGWAIDLNKLNENSVIYSFGVGTDISFDEQLINLKKCNVYGFDPTPRSVKWVNDNKLPNQFIFKNIGLSDFDGYADFNEPPRPDWVSYSETKSPNGKSIKCEVKKLKSIMTLMGHSSIDLIKMDIEGSEYGVLNDMLSDEILPNQIMVEFHGNNIELINSFIDRFGSYDIFKKFDRPDYYMIKKNV